MENSTLAHPQLHNYSICLKKNIPCTVAQSWVNISDSGIHPTKSPKITFILLFFIFIILLISHHMCHHIELFNLAPMRAAISVQQVI